VKASSRMSETANPRFGTVCLAKIESLREIGRMGLGQLATDVQCFLEGCLGFLHPLRVAVEYRQAVTMPSARCSLRSRL